MRMVSVPVNQVWLGLRKTWCNNKLRRSPLVDGGDLLSFICDEQTGVSQEEMVEWVHEYLKRQAQHHDGRCSPASDLL